MKRKKYNKKNSLRNAIKFKKRELYLRMNAKI
jgi:hypothetical protein